MRRTSSSLQAVSVPVKNNHMGLRDLWDLDILRVVREYSKVLIGEQAKMSETLSGSIGYQRYMYIHICIYIYMVHARHSSFT